MDTGIEREQLKRSGSPSFQNVERLRLCLGMDVKPWSEGVGTTVADYSALRDRAEVVPEKMLESLESFVRLKPGTLRTSRWDYRKISAHSMSDAELGLPDKYSTAPRSRRRTSINILDYVENFVGWKESLRIVRNLGLKPGHFADADSTINILFLTELLAELRKEKYSSHDFFTMGAYSLVTNRDTELGQAFSRLSGPAEVYERLFGELMGFYEQNHDYRLIELNAERCVAEVRPREDVTSELKVRYLGSADVCLSKCGVAASVMGYLGLPFAQVRKASCVHHGDETCRFEINFAFPARVYRKIAP